MYVHRRIDADRLAASLSSKGIPSVAYHAGLRDAARETALRLWLGSEVSCAVATIAFGMGIDKPDVRIVVHWSLPKDIGESGDDVCKAGVRGSQSTVQPWHPSWACIDMTRLLWPDRSLVGTWRAESFYQESGRAGRDGRPSQSVVFYSDRDKRTRAFLVGKENRRSRRKAWGAEGRGGAEAGGRAVRDRVGAFETMVGALCGVKCRRRTVLTHFLGQRGEDDRVWGTEEDWRIVRGGGRGGAACCDVCGDPEGVVAAARAAAAALAARCEELWVGAWGRGAHRDCNSRSQQHARL